MENNQKNCKICEICGITATCLCFKCIMYFCDSCFILIHNKEINKTHKKETIDYFVPFDLKCPDHPKNPVNLFCDDEKGKILLIYKIF